jgi:hypothetical protein
VYAITLLAVLVGLARLSMRERARHQALDASVPATKPLNSGRRSASG